MDILKEVSIGLHHKNAVITLVGRLTKCIIVSRPDGWQTDNVDKSPSQWLEYLPKHLWFLNAGRSFPIGIHKQLTRHWCLFADSTLFRKNHSPEQKDFNPPLLEQISNVEFYRNHLPRNTLDYRTPIKIMSAIYLMKYVVSLHLINQIINY